MTLVIILGAAAAIYSLILLFRCATFALPVFAGLGIALRLHEMGHGWLAAMLAGLTTGVTILGMGRLVARSGASVWLRFLVILLFAGAAAAAGYQAGTALAILGGLGPVWQHAFGTLAGLVTGCRSWRDLVTPASGTGTRFRSPEAVSAHHRLTVSSSAPASRCSRPAAPSRPLDMRDLPASRCAGPAWCNRARRLSSPGVPPFLAKQESRRAPSSAPLRAFGCTAGPSPATDAHRGRDGAARHRKGMHHGQDRHVQESRKSV